VLAVIGDTHGESHHRLEGRTRRAVRTADHVCHTGDFTTTAVYEAIADAAGADVDGQAGADVTVVGHTHRPGIEETPAGLVLNPGSYADPRDSRPAHAGVGGQELTVAVYAPDDSGVRAGR